MKKKDFPERRRYIRLKKIFPVEFRIIDSGNQPLSGLLQGFSRDVGFNGICLEINQLSPEQLEQLRSDQARLHLFLNLTTWQEPVKATGRLCWDRPGSSTHPHSRLLGIEYVTIDSSEQKRVIRYARNSRFINQAAVSLFVLMIVFSVALTLENVRLSQSNKSLLRDFIRFTERQQDTRNQLNRLRLEKQIVERMLEKGQMESEVLRRELKKLGEELAQRPALEAARAEEELQLLNIRLASIIREKSLLEKKLREMEQSETRLENRLTSIKGQREVLETKSRELMYQWIKSSQNGRTGLVISYDGDPALEDAAFTYDQALSAFNFMNFRDFERAEHIFRFYRDHAKRVNGGFANAYDATTGKVTEYLVQSGPCVYLGLAVIRYGRLTGDEQFLKLAREIGEWLLGLQEPISGRIRGGPELEWSSTEHNLSARFFLQLLGEETGDNRFTEAGLKVLEWIKQEGFNRKLNRFNRGQNDIMIATDTFSLAILSLGVEALEEMGIDPETLVRSVEETCRTRITFRNAFNRRITITGFDFCCPSSIGRKGTIAIEWTAQMITAFQELSRYYSGKGDREKAAYYSERAEFHLEELEKLVLIRWQVGKKQVAGLPYALDGGVDTGHGWFTPLETAISASGTNFAIFAKEGYNIFSK